MGEGFDEVQLADIKLFPVVEGDVTNIDGGGPAVRVFGGQFTRLEAGESDKGLECGAGRVGGAIGARKEGNGGILAELFVDLGVEDGNEVVGIILRPGGHGMNLSGPWIDHDYGSLFAIFLQDLFADSLEILVEGGDDCVSWNGGLSDAFGGFVAIGIIGDMEAPRLALELKIEGLLDPLTALAFGENEILVLNRTNGERCLLAGVSENVGRKFSVGIKAGIDLLEHQCAGESASRHGELLGLEIIKQSQRQKAPVAVMIEDGLIADGDRSFKQTLGKGDLRSGKGNNLGFLPIKRSRTLQGQMIAPSGMPS